MFWFTTNIVSDSKARWIVEYIIEKKSVRLPDLMNIRINWERLASVSTHISDWRKYAERLGYRIVNDIKHSKKKCDSVYKAELII